MRLGHVPLAQVGRFVVIDVHVDAHGDFRERVGEVEIGRRREHRIAADDDEHLHAAGLHIGHELGERRGAIGGRRGDGRVIRHGRADVAERFVHRARERVYGSRLGVARNHGRASTVIGEIGADRGDPLRRRCRSRGGRRPRRADGGGERRRERVHVA